VRASQYESALSLGAGVSGGSATRLSVPSGCIHSTTLPASGPLAVWRYVSPRSSWYAFTRLDAVPVARQCRR